MTVSATATALETGEVLVLNAGSSSLKVSVHGRGGDRLWSDQRGWSIAAAEGNAPHERLEAVLDAWLPEALAAWG